MRIGSWETKFRGLLDKLEARLWPALLDGRDGFVAIDPATGKVVDGTPGGAQLRRELLPRFFLDGLSSFVAPGDGGERIEFRLGGKRLASGQTGEDGFEPLSARDLAALPLPKRVLQEGGLLHVEASAKGKTVSQRVLALPRDYDGPIFISDIDDTLRATRVVDVARGDNEHPVPGARELLEGVARRKVPIVYLSAAPTAMGTYNDRFLSQLPEGILLSREQIALRGLLPTRSAQARAQGDFKARQIAALKRVFPKAKLFGLGDAKFGDRDAYAREGVRAFIGQGRYDATFREKLFQELDAS